VARIPYPESEALTPENRAFLADLPQLNISRMLAASPGMFKPLTRVFNSYLNEGLLSDEMREIVILRVGNLLDSEYEVVHHERVAKLIGMAPEKVAALSPHQPQDAFTGDERDVLRYVDEVVRDGGASQETFDAVATFMSAAEMVELTLVAGVYTLVSQFCTTFGIELEDVPIADTGIEDIKSTVDKHR
jgi:alkylhydroperoxidase family enzyme